MARDANAGNAKLPQPWESLRKLIILKRSELDEKKEKALFYAVLALEEAFGVYRSALREVVEGLGKAVQRVEVVEEPFRRVMYMADLGRLTQLAEEEGKAFENALKILRERLNEYAVKYGLRDLLDVKEGVARRLAEAKAPELSEFGDVNFGVKAYAALIAYREYALGRRSVFGAAAWYWLEVGGSAWLLYYAPSTAYKEAEKAGVERLAAVEELVAEALRRLFLKPGADRYRGLVEELTKGGRLALELEEEKTKKKTESYVFRLFKLEEGGEFKELGIKLSIRKVGEGEGMTYTLIFGMKRWRGFFEQMLEVAMKAAGEVGGRLSVEDSLLYMLGWVDSDVAIIRKKKGNRVLRMSTSHRWQLAETHALFDWSYVAVLGVSLTLEGPKLAVTVEAPLERLDEAIKKSAVGGWLKMQGVEAESWDGLKRWVADHWGEVIGAVKRRLESVEVGSGFDLARALEELERLKNRLDDDKIAREVVAPALLLMQAEKLGVNEATLKYFGAVLWGAVGGDGYVSAAEKEVNLTSGEGAVTLLWAAAWSAYGVRPRVAGAGRVFHVVALNDGAVRLAQLCVLFGPPMLEEEGYISHKLVEAVELGSKVSVQIEERSWRQIKDGAAVDLYISAGGVTRKFNLHLQEKVLLEFRSTDREEVELEARLLSLAGVEGRVRKEGNRDVWYIQAYTDQLAEGNEELRKGLVKAVEGALRRGLIDDEKAKRWIEKFEKGVSTWRGYKFKIGLSGGALQVKFQSTNPENIRKLKQELESLGLREGEHFTVKWSEDEKIGYIYIAREGIIELAYIAKYGTDEAQRLGAASLIEHLRIKAELASKEVLVKLGELVREGESRRSLHAERLKTIVEIEWKGRHVEVSVEVKNIKAWEDGDKLRIVVGAIVGGVEGQWTATFRRTKKNAIEGYTVARVNAPGGREEDAKRIIALVKALTGEEPNIKLDKGKPVIIYTRRHLNGFKKYAEVADTIREWEWKSVYARRG
jgi:hypothetical protein